VQFADVLEIRRGWIKRGRPPCDHGRLAGERYLVADTGDDACLDYGEECSRSDRTPTKDPVSESWLRAIASGRHLSSRVLERVSSDAGARPPPLWQWLDGGPRLRI